MSSSEYEDAWKNDRYDPTAPMGKSPNDFSLDQEDAQRATFEAAAQNRKNYGQNAPGASGASGVPLSGHLQTKKANQAISSISSRIQLLSTSKDAKSQKELGRLKTLRAQLANRLTQPVVGS